MPSAGSTSRFKRKNRNSPIGQTNSGFDTGKRCLRLGRNELVNAWKITRFGEDASGLSTSESNRNIRAAETLHSEAVDGLVPSARDGPRFDAVVQAEVAEDLLGRSNGRSPTFTSPYFYHPGFSCGSGFESWRRSSPREDR